MKPATTLPWLLQKTDFESGFATVAHIGDYRLGVETGVKGGNYRDGAIGDDRQDAIYMHRAANAYPRLVEALRKHARCEDGGDDASALLRELGELK